MEEEEADWVEIVVDVAVVEGAERESERVCGTGWVLQNCEERNDGEKA